MTVPENKKNKKTLVSATTIIVALLIIVIAANVVIWKGRLDKGSEITLLNGEMAQVSHEINTTSGPLSDMEARLTAAQADLAAAQSALPERFNRNNIIDYIIKLSRQCQVEVLPISSQGWGVETAGQSYPVLKLNAIITGTFAQANDFIYKLQHGAYRALVIPDISVARQSAPEPSGVFSAEQTKVTVRLTISIYARPDAAVESN
jgi:hypothetical protein